MPCGRRGLDYPPGFGAELKCHSFIRIDLKNPIAPASVDPRLPPWPFPLPGSLDEVSGEAERDVARAILAAVQHHDDFVCESKTRQTLGELTLLVLDDDKDGQFGSGHAASLAIERHSLSAAASAASTESPSIKVSVVRWSKPGPNITSGRSA